MRSQTNRQVRLKSRPTGIPLPDNFEIVPKPFPEIANRQFLVGNEYLSVEPAMRGWVSATASYSTPVSIGDVMRAFSAGTIVTSRPDWRPSRCPAPPPWHGSNSFSYAVAYRALRDRRGS